ncbi:uncharacterized protein LOC114405862 [Glycine soja]|uniref:DUF4378 domain-containing protein n=1 Tax=Glycine soja TaxID=3848 RepID=A0A445M706_GLYSO|nr:uncharacterized protein LOC114405862 [Glycine soja]KHN25731.1 hypothetical protein glysoja_018305 [Glycine soja]RZC31171.1 hypothetical protein D0Y65_002240 [Glycine soja]
MASGSGKPRTYQMVVAKANHRKTRTLLLLKDYLRDDLSSCSSSGFRSLPRRQCCLQQLQPRASAKSVLQKALEALFNAIKSRNKGGVGVLSRSFFWKKASKRESISTCSLTDVEMEGSVTTTNTCSVTNSARVDSRGKKDWTKVKEQFSPVSVLDCPLFDDDEESTSPFSSPSRSTLEGAKHIQQRRHFNRVDLEKKMSWSELREDESIYNYPTKPCPVLVSITSTQNENNNLLHDSVEKNALDLLTRVKNSISSVCLRIEMEKLLFDFFKQSIWENTDIKNSMKCHLCNVAEDWIRGQSHVQDLSLQTRKGREIYVKEMDKCGSWRTFEEEIQGLAMELEVEFSTRLVNELVVDLTMCFF